MKYGACVTATQVIIKQLATINRQTVPNMSNTDHKTKSGQLITKEDPESNVIRMSAGAIDEQYIQCYLDNPSSKVGALRAAQKISGIDCYVTRSRAADIHKRLEHRINGALSDLVNESAVLGITVLVDLAAHSDNDAVRAGCASKLVEYAGTNKPQIDLAPKDRSNIKQQIENTKARILQITGKAKV